MDEATPKKYRSLADRLKEEFSDVRWELENEVRRFAPEEIDWVPQPGMKSCRAMLEEIGVMEAVCAALVIEGVNHDEEEMARSLAWTGNDPNMGLALLAAVRAKTVAYLDQTTDELLRKPRRVPGGFGGHPEIEPEEVFRWIARHEYYHLGQLVTYRWALGDHPYERD